MSRAHICMMSKHRLYISIMKKLPWQENIYIYIQYMLLVFGARRPAAAWCTTCEVCCSCFFAHGSDSQSDPPHTHNQTHRLIISPSVQNILSHSLFFLLYIAYYYFTAAARRRHAAFFFLVLFSANVSPSHSNLLLYRQHIVYTVPDYMFVIIVFQWILYDLPAFNK